MTTAKVKVTFHPPPPPDGRPNYRPSGFHIYEIRDEAGRKLVSGSIGPDKDEAQASAIRQARGKGFDTVEVIYEIRV
jgi:hypothetical protein